MRRAGFTLLEMMVATVIMGIAVVGLLSGISGAMRNAGRLTDYDRAVLLGRAKMDELLVDKYLPKLAALGGTFDEAATGGVECGWRARLAPFEMPPNVSRGVPILERLELEIWWMSGGRRRTLSLEGYRTALFMPPEAGE